MRASTAFGGRCESCLRWEPCGCCNSHLLGMFRWGYEICFSCCAISHRWPAQLNRFSHPCCAVLRVVWQRFACCRQRGSVVCTAVCVCRFIWRRTGASSLHHAIHGSSRLLLNHSDGFYFSTRGRLSHPCCACLLYTSDAADICSV